MDGPAGQGAPDRRRPSLLRRFSPLLVALLAIEFLDEFVWGAREAAWPLIRDDLALTYAQVGLLLSIPNIVSSIAEPFLGVLGDVWKRRNLILGGGVLFALSMLLIFGSRTFALLLVAFSLYYPASGGLVGLAQAALMDHAPERREQNMVRWTVAGGVGVVLGPLVLGAAGLLGSGWRGLFLAFALLTAVLVLAARRAPLVGGAEQTTLAAVWRGLVEAARALGRPAVLRWLTLLTFSDLLLDVLLGFLALYLVDVGEMEQWLAGVGVSIWTGAALLGEVLLIPLLERVRGLRYLRLSALVEMLLFTAFLLLPLPWMRLILLGLLGLFSAGWYSLLRAHLYAAMPGQSGTVMAVDNLFGLVGGLVPLGLGLLAERVGLQTTMWLLLLGPVALLAGLSTVER